jgi:apolipoprotein D and lipocalin family protein
MRILVLTCSLLAAGCVINPVYRTLDTPLTTEPIDQQRYLGLWREQARLPNAFERGCVRAQAEYGLRADGLISVINTCETADGRIRVARGRARPHGEAGDGKLEVSFFGPFWADYWVLDRADDYSWSIVGEGGGRYLWLLTREEHLSASQRQELEARIAALGYPLRSLVWRQ